MANWKGILGSKERTCSQQWRWNRRCRLHLDVPQYSPAQLLLQTHKSPDKLNRKNKNPEKKCELSRKHEKKKKRLPKRKTNLRRGRKRSRHGIKWENLQWRRRGGRPWLSNHHQMRIFRPSDPRRTRHLPLSRHPINTTFHCYSVIITITTIRKEGGCSSRISEEEQAEEDFVNSSGMFEFSVSFQ